MRNPGCICHIPDPLWAYSARNPCHDPHFGNLLSYPTLGGNCIVVNLFPTSGRSGSDFSTLVLALTIAL